MRPIPIEQYRWPLALGLLVVAAFFLWTRASGDADAPASPSPSIVVGEVGGEVLTDTPAPSEPATPSPSFSPVATASPSATPAADGFEAEVLACRSISGSRCRDELGTLRPSASTFTALVRFTDARAGDVMNAILSGPGGTVEGGAHALEGGGDGYYYAQFQAGGLPAGDYTLTATRNGEEVATTSFRKVGN